MGKKSTAAAVELRTAKVAELLIDGWSRARICAKNAMGRE